MKTATQFQESIRHILCMSSADFVAIWGADTGAYLWNKFKVEYKNDAARFICYLDGGNIQLLFAALTKYLAEIEFLKGRAQ